MARWRTPVPAGARPDGPLEPGEQDMGSQLGRGDMLARSLTRADLAAALAVCAVDPVASVLATARLEIAARSGFGAAAGQAWGFPAVGPLEAVCWSGANLVPVVPITDPARRAEAIAAFTTVARIYGRRSSSIVGEQRAALALWERLSPHWPAARDVRADQPSMAIGADPLVTPEPTVRRSVPSELELVLPACVRMFTEEVGYSPIAAGGSAYAERVRSLITEGRSFVRLVPDGDGRPAVGFKAELGAVAGGVAQVQGVWVEPAFRGRGWSESGMAAVVAATRSTIAPVVSLYVNAYNERAMAAYRRVGFEQVGTFATVLF
ncbi:GNAT family N-acetyltransferase [Promicromonospora sukumoe]|uniref:GNAT family N-acetyltransferase n=1 Tax=Promicromonospora sukumoe TaxID=88382 RepID=UPI00364E8FB7